MSGFAWELAKLGLVFFVVFSSPNFGGVLIGLGMYALLNVID